MSTATLEVGSRAALDVDTFRYWMSTQGYVVVPGAVDAARLDALRLGIDAAIESDAAAQSGAYTEKRFYDIVHLLMNRGACFIDLLEHMPCMELFEAIVSATCVLHSYNAVKLMPGRGNNATNVHRDSPRYSPGYMLAVQGLLCVDDFTADNGATWLLPGSHHAEARPTDAMFHERAIQVPAPAGSLIIFDSSVWHASGTNNTDQPRRGITLVFTRAFMKQQIDLPRALDPHLIDGLSPRTRRLLGFDVRVPSSLDEFFLPQEQRLYKANQG